MNILSPMEALTSHQSSRSTGTLILMFTDNTLAQVYCEVGVVMHARYLKSEGIDALTLINTSIVKSSVFHENVNATDSTQPVSETVAQPTEDPNAVRAAEPVEVIQHLTEADKAILIELLTEYIGPVAKILVDKADLDQPKDQVMKKLAINIISQDDSLEFMSMANQVLARP